MPHCRRTGRARYLRHSRVELTPKRALRKIELRMRDVTTQLERFLLKSPTLGRSVFVAPGAVVLGDVRLHDCASIWYGAVLRGDINYIEVGHHSNIQDNSVLHLADEFPCVIGNYVTVGHAALVHACTIGNEVLVGMGSTILDGAVIGDQCLIGARALITPGSRIPAGSLVLGSPAKVARALEPAERARLKKWAEKYVEVAAFYLEHPTASNSLPSKPSVHTHDKNLVEERLVVPHTPNISDLPSVR